MALIWLQEPGSCVCFDLIRNWAEDRGIYDKGDAKTQYIKLAEEFGELGKGLLKQDQRRDHRCYWRYGCCIN